MILVIGCSSFGFCAIETLAEKTESSHDILVIDAEHSDSLLEEIEMVLIAPPEAINLVALDNPKADNLNVKEIIKSVSLNEKAKETIVHESYRRARDGLRC